MSKETGAKTYEDFEPELEQLRKDGTDTILISLPDFKKEQLRVQLDSYGYLKITGERPVSGNKWSRFHKQARVPDNCNINEIRAKLDNGVLHITMPQLIAQASGPDQSKTGRETPKKAERQEKDKHDARPKTTAAAAPAAAAETQTKKATDPLASDDSAHQKAVGKKPTREKAEDAFGPVDSTSAALARKEADGKQEEARGKPAAAAQKLPQQLGKSAVASAGTGEPDQQQQEMGGEKGGDVRLPEGKTEKAKDGAKKEKEEDGGAVGSWRKPDVATGDGSLEGGKRRAREEKQGGVVEGVGQRKQLVVNVVVASLLVVGLGFYIATKLRSHGDKE